MTTKYLFTQMLECWLNKIYIVPDSDVGPDSNTTSSSSRQSFVACRVCGDKASGYHYGVTSCEGCKVGCYFIMCMWEV